MLLRSCITSAYRLFVLAASKYVPSDANGNEITGTAKEVADAIRQYFLDLTYVVSYTTSQIITLTHAAALINFIWFSIQVPNENCDDPSQETCAFWMGDLNKATVDGLHDILVTSECDIPKVVIEKATELSHATNNFGKSRTSLLHV